MLLTIAEISKRLNVPESTLRSWRDKYDDYIPSQGTGRKKRYTERSVNVFELIARLAAENLTADAIAEHLSSEYPRHIDIPQDNSSTTAATQIMTLQRSLQGINTTLERLADQQAENERLKQKIEQLEQRLSSLENKPGILSRIFRKN